MLRSIALFSVLVYAAGNVGAEEHKLIAMSEWSKPVESHDRFLQARWLLLEGCSRAYAGAGKEVLLHVELQNAKSLGDLLDHLEMLGIAENTLILFLGDNGSDAPLGHEHEVACAAPLRGKKGAHYEGGMRVPFIAAWAKARPDSPHQQRLPIPAGTIQPQLASVCDLFPTILHLVGVTPPPGHVVDGMRLDTLLAGMTDSSRAETFLMHYPHAPHRSNYWTSYRDGRWKVIYHYVPSAAWENSHYQLFDLAADPFEQHNLATSHPDDLRRMMRGLIATLESYDAVYPLDDDRTTPRRPKLP